MDIILSPFHEIRNLKIQDLGDYFRMEPRRWKNKKFSLKYLHLANIIVPRYELDKRN